MYTYTFLDARRHPGRQAIVIKINPPVYAHTFLALLLLLLLLIHFANRKTDADKLSSIRALLMRQEYDLNRLKDDITDHLAHHVTTRRLDSGLRDLKQEILETLSVHMRNAEHGRAREEKERQLAERTRKAEAEIYAPLAHQPAIIGEQLVRDGKSKREKVMETSTSPLSPRLKKPSKAESSSNPSSKSNSEVNLKSKTFRRTLDVGALGQNVYHSSSSAEPINLCLPKSRTTATSSKEREKWSATPEKGSKGGPSRGPGNSHEAGNTVVDVWEALRDSALPR